MPGNFRGDGCDQHCSTSQPVNWRLQPQRSRKCPLIAGFCRFSSRLQAPNSNNLRAKSPIVSGQYLKYSRFWETRAGDQARSALRGVGRSLNQVFLRKRRPQAPTNSAAECPATHARIRKIFCNKICHQGYRAVTMVRDCPESQAEAECTEVRSDLGTVEASNQRIQKFIIG